MMRHHTPHGAAGNLAAAAFASVLLSSMPALAGAVPIEVLTYLGETSPELGEVVLLAANPSLNASGPFYTTILANEALFGANISGLALFDGPAAEGPLLVEGQSFLGLGLVVSFNALLPQDDGSLVFTGSAGEDIFSTSDGVRLFANGTVRTLFSRESAIPGLEPGDELAFVFNVAARGRFVRADAFINKPDFTAENAAFLIDSQTGEIRRLATAGGAVPLAEFAGARFAPAIGPTQINGSGQSIIASYVEGPGFQFGNDAVLLRTSFDGTLDVVSRSGAQAPGFPEGATPIVYSNAVINDAGTIATVAILAGPGTDPDFFSAQLYTYDAQNNLTVHATSGEQAPGLAPGVEVFGVRGSALNGSGDLAYIVQTLPDGGDPFSDAGVALYTEINGETRLITSNGAPDPAGGGIFLDIGGEVPLFNARGQVAFIGLLLDLQTRQQYNGLYATQPDGTLVRIARTGDTVEVAPGDVRVITLLDLSSLGGSLGGENGTGRSFNDAGDLGFSVGLDELTGAVLLARVNGEAPTCPADFNGDTTPGDIFDLFDFLAALDGGLDFNGDTTPADIFDLFDFLAVLDAGCP